jgi:hypothetical protein
MNWVRQTSSQRECHSAEDTLDFSRIKPGAVSSGFDQSTREQRQCLWMLRLECIEGKIDQDERFSMEQQQIQFSGRMKCHSGRRSV